MRFACIHIVCFLFFFFRGNVFAARSTPKPALKPSTPKATPRPVPKPTPKPVPLMSAMAMYDEKDCQNPVMVTYIANNCNSKDMMNCMTPSSSMGKITSAESRCVLDPLEDTKKELVQQVNDRKFLQIQGFQDPQCKEMVMAITYWFQKSECITLGQNISVKMTFHANQILRFSQFSDPNCSTFDENPMLLMENQVNTGNCTQSTPTKVFTNAEFH